ncbi:MAG: hypothetical protein QOI66_5031 [Myxococcales bacterium]|nr:hypothetical protein [Myxococcales bacterium]
MIYARCRRLLIDEGAAEDATQETFMRVYRHIEQAPDVHEALTWIYRIATNCCLNEIRARRLRPEPRETLPEPGLSGGGVTFENRFVDQDLVRRLIGRAGSKLQGPAWLYHVDGLEQEDVARVLGLSRRTVAARLKAFAANARKFLGRNRQS